jgi:diguanylate cyclase (GGDEF)-like protein
VSRLSTALTLLIEELAFLAGRQHRELEVLLSLAEELERTDDSSSVARALLDAAVSTYGFSRGVVLASSAGHLPLLASFRLEDEVARRPGRPGLSAAVAEAHEQQATVLVRGLDATADPWLARLLPGATNLVVVPLSAEGRPLGALVVEHTGSARIQRRIVTCLERSATYAGLALRNAWLLEQVQRLAATDSLTKIANRRTFEATLEREVARATRNVEQVSLVMIDIDHFKALNDTHGHQAGDQALVEFARALDVACRDTETPARYGGEEFCVVLPGVGPHEAWERADSLRLAAAGGCERPINASAGVECWSTGMTLAQLVGRADAALYASKVRGRNRTTMAGEVRADERKPMAAGEVKIVLPEDKVTPAEVAAAWWAQQLGVHVSTDEVVEVGLASTCNLRTPEGDLCLRGDGHAGLHRAVRFMDDRGRSWEILR